MPTVFTSGATVVTVSRNPTFPYAPKTDKNQKLGYTAGGTAIIHGNGVAVTPVTLTFKNIITSERNSLYSFWYTTIDGAKNTFTLDITDAGGAVLATHTARWIDKDFPLSMESEGKWGGQITLRYEDA